MQIKTKIVSFRTADSKPVNQEVNGTVILPPLVFPGKKLLRRFVWSKPGVSDAVVLAEVEKGNEANHEP